MVRRIAGISASSNLLSSVSCSFVIGASALTRASRIRTSRSGGGGAGAAPRAGVVAAPRAGAEGLSRLPGSPNAPKSTSCAKALDANKRKASEPSRYFIELEPRIQSQYERTARVKARGLAKQG